MAKARGLGRGLSALIPDRTGEIMVESAESELRESGVQRVPVDRIESNPFQPRREFNEQELLDLAQSIRVHGVIQPVLLRKVGLKYQLVAGERRVRAARLAGLVDIPAICRDINDQEAMEIALVENLQRSDLNPIEESLAYQRLIEEFEWTQEEIGARVGKSRSHVANYLRLLQLEENIQRLLGGQELSVAHGKVLLSVSGPRRVELAERAAREGWTVKQLEAYAVRGEVPSPAVNALDVHLKAVESGLRRRFGTKVTFRGDANKGRIEIAYRSLEELERILGILDSDSSDSGDGFVV